jgi:hypothetical protein
MKQMHRRQNSRPILFKLLLLTTRFLLVTVIELWWMNNKLLELSRERTILQ